MKEGYYLESYDYIYCQMRQRRQPTKQRRKIVFLRLLKNEERQIMIVLSITIHSILSTNGCSFVLSFVELLSSSSSSASSAVTSVASSYCLSSFSSPIRLVKLLNYKQASYSSSIQIIGINQSSHRSIIYSNNCIYMSMPSSFFCPFHYAFENKAISKQPYFLSIHFAQKAIK